MHKYVFWDLHGWVIHCGGKLSYGPWHAPLTSFLLEPVCNSTFATLSWRMRSSIVDCPTEKGSNGLQRSAPKRYWKTTPFSCRSLEVPGPRITELEVPDTRSGAHQDTG